MGLPKVNEILFRFIRAIGGLRLIKHFTRRHPRILMYHRVLPTSEYGAITIEEFRKQLDFLKESFQIITLQELFNSLDEGRKVKNVAVLTFDDGYYDFYQYAFPVLREKGINATLFITSGFIDGKLWLWPDQLEHCLKETSQTNLDITELGISYNLQSDDNRCWRDTANYCLTLDEHEKCIFIDRLYSEAGVEKSLRPPSDYRPMSWDELRNMVQQGLDVGSHSHSHPVLTKVDHERLKIEMIKSRDLISKNLGLTNIGFCYPNGQASDFNDMIKKEAKKTGYRYCVSAFPSSSPISDRWEINRYPANKDFAIFEKNMYGLTYIKLKLISIIRKGIKK